MIAKEKTNQFGQLAGFKNILQKPLDYIKSICCPVPQEIIFLVIASQIVQIAGFIAGGTS